MLIYGLKESEYPFGCYDNFSIITKRPVSRTLALLARSENVRSAGRWHFWLVLKTSGSPDVGTQRVKNLHKSYKPIGLFDLPFCITCKLNYN